MSIFSEEVKEAASKLSSKYVKAEEFEGNGVILKVIKAEKVKANSPKFGANEEDTLVKQEILEVGETMRYVFETPEGTERWVESKSAAIFIAFNSAPLEGGEWVRISKTGKMENTRYSIGVVEAPQSNTKASTTKDEIKDDINPDDIPF